MIRSLSLKSITIYLISKLDYPARAMQIILCIDLSLRYTIKMFVNKTNLFTKITDYYVEIVAGLQSSVTVLLHSNEVTSLTAILLSPSC